MANIFNKYRLLQQQHPVYRQFLRSIFISLSLTCFVAEANNREATTGESVPSAKTIDVRTLASLSNNTATLLNMKPIDRAKLPVAYLVSKDRLIELTCPEQPMQCSAKVAVFDTRFFHILLDESLTDKEPEVLKSFVVHELVHVYQYYRQTGEVRNQCNLHLQNEREAYRIQNRFLSDAGLHYNFGQELRGALCPVLAPVR